MHETHLGCEAVKIIAFSKDRAAQLDAMLRSMREHVDPMPKVHVLYKATNERNENAYAEAFYYHPAAIPIKEGVFKLDLLGLLPTTGNVMFLVDDLVFVRPWQVLEEPGLSLRLGLNLTHNYTTHDSLQPLPADLQDLGGGLITWKWSSGAMAWSYPLSLDGHVFDAKEMLRLLKPLIFHSPNTLESVMQNYINIFWQRNGICYYESKIVGVPWNQVQSDWYNRCGTEHSAEKLLNHWEEGFRIDVRELYGVYNKSVHQEFPLALERR